MRAPIERSDTPAIASPSPASADKQVRFYTVSIKTPFKTPYNGTQKHPRTVLSFPLTQILLGLLVCLGLVVIGQLAAQQLLKLTALGKDAKTLINGGVGALGILGSYLVWFRFHEKRVISELSLKGMGWQLIAGIALGALLQAVTILVIYLNGGFRVMVINPVGFVLPSLASAGVVAIFEEIVVRGIVFRLIEKRFGSYLALLLSALIFGALHLANPNSSLLTALGLAIQAGLLLRAAYIYARSLWFPIAIHFAWNFTETGIFGARVSGNAVSRALLTTKIEGPTGSPVANSGRKGPFRQRCFV